MNILQKSSSPKSHARRFFFLIIVLIIILALTFTAALYLGSAKISFGDFLDALFRKTSGSAEQKIIFYLRLPRALAAVLAGAALAGAGTIIQAVLNNPMASPSVIGVNSGAGLGAVIALSVFPLSIRVLPLFAFLGALGACLLIYLIAQKHNADRITVTLVGLAVGSVLSAVTNLIKSMFEDSAYDTNMYFIGGVSNVDTRVLSTAAIPLFFALIITILLSKHLDILCLGDETALGLGLNLRLFKPLLLITASILSGLAVSFAGLLGFVGLLVPHIARRFTGNSHNRLIPVSLLMGSILVLLCDLLGRVVMPPYEISVGIILSLLGGPFFICLILFKRNTVFYD